MTSSNRPFFSIITVTYNSSKTLERTFESLLNQNFKSFEYILIDGNSQDNTLDIIKTYQVKFENEGIAFKWISEGDDGIYDAMNKGITMSRGKMIGIINSDDYYESTALKEVYKHYLLEPNAEVYHGLLKYYNDNQLISIKGESDIVLTNRMIQHPSTFIVYEAYKKYGMFDTNYKYVADYELLLRIKDQGGSFSFIHKVLANFYDGGVGDSIDSRKEAQVLKLNKKIISKKRFLINLIKIYVIDFFNKRKRL